MPDLTVCSVCGVPQPEKEMLRYGDRFVCASCKPIFLHRLREGTAETVGGPVYGGFWIRFAARFLDGILLAVVNFIVSLPLTLMSTDLIEQQPEAILGFACVTYLIQFAFAAAYETFFLATRGATPGKMAFGLRVERSDGTKLSAGRAFGRYVGTLLSAMVLFIGYLMAAFDEQKRALHDLLCDTRVVRT